MRINREKLLEQLESVSPGLSAKEIIEQSSCFVFQDKTVMTYNDEIACTQKSCLTIKGAVTAMPFISILRKLKEDELEITASKEELLIKGKRKKIGLKMDVGILLPIDSIEKPKKWKDLPEDFANAISIVHQCSGKDETKFSLTCGHLTPKWVEACDGYQAARYKMKMEVEKPTLVRKESIKYIIELDMTEFSETKNWIHFRNSSGLVLSCRRWVEDFPELSELLNVKGTPTKFPKGLIEAVEKAEIFSAENAEDNQVEINLKPNKLRITGRGDSGYYQEVKNIKYEGKSLSFRVSAGLFADLIRHHNSCEITSDRLKVVTGKYSYVTVLQVIVD
ncbi:MAG: hypothetical protein QQN41_09645 [Nitrosopumilus sp.]